MFLLIDPTCTFIIKIYFSRHEYEFLVLFWKSFQYNITYAINFSLLKVSVDGTFFLKKLLFKVYTRAYIIIFQYL